MTARHLTPYHRERHEREMRRSLWLIAAGIAWLALYVSVLKATGVL